MSAERPTSHPAPSWPVGAGVSHHDGPGGSRRVVSHPDEPADDRPVVAHLVTPYLFSTGSWVHSQLRFTTEFRPIVLTQMTQNLEIFPHDEIHDLGPFGQAASAARSAWSRATWNAHRLLLGEYPLGPYRRVLEARSVRLIHAHLGWEGARTARLARAPRRPFVVSFYGRDGGKLARHPYWRVLYRRLFRLADRVIVEGPFMARTLERIGAPADRIRVVHLGIPLEQFPFVQRQPPATAGQGTAVHAGAAGQHARLEEASAHGGSDGEVIGLIAASFREKKGIIYGLEAVARVAREFPRLRLRIIGDGPLRSEIERRAAQADLAGRVDLLGYLAYPQYRLELARAHFFLAPSCTARDGDAEGGAPVCLLEAQASGLPVVSTTHCDIPEVTRPGESALLAPERDANALASLLQQLLRQPERWRAMGEAGRRHVEAEFDIRRQVERMGEVYRELLPDSATAPQR